MNLENLRFPVGRYKKPSTITEALISDWIQEIEDFPKQVISLLKEMGKTELNLRYRPEGWTIKQVIHHCADSHMNSLMRFKLALTEEAPTIRPYYEDRWAELPDSLEDEVEDSLQILSGLHRKWGKLLRTLTAEDLQKTFVHPEHGTSIALDENIAVYAWHCRHHLAHIQSALQYREQWTIK